MKITTILFAFLGIAIFISCSDDSDVGYQEEQLQVSLLAPDYGQPQAGSTSNGNQIIHLGRILFYDKKLSATSTVSCGSCHVQAFAFADPFRHSVGIGSQFSERNTPTIINSTFGRGLFWDQSANDLDDLITRPIQNHKEMGFGDLDALAIKLSTTAYYRELFELAYGDKVITKDRISQALTHFVSQLTSFDSRSDKMSNGQIALTPLEQHGMQLFDEKGCNGCHQITSSGSLFLENRVDITGGNFSGGYTGAPRVGANANIGLNASYADNGVGLITGISDDNGKFKIPSLRNVTLTPPYMHDGRFATLHDVLDFYDSGIAPHPNLDDRLKDDQGLPQRLGLTVSDKHAIIAFLGTLTSEEILQDERWSDPF